MSPPLLQWGKQWKVGACSGENNSGGQVPLAPTSCPLSISPHLSTSCPPHTCCWPWPWNHYTVQLLLLTVACPPCQKPLITMHIVEKRKKFLYEKYCKCFKKFYVSGCINTKNVVQTCLRPIFLLSHICLKFQKKGWSHF